MSFANVFGEHKDIAAGKYLIPYVEPEFVQDTSRIRVLFAKEAVSNGWDCRERRSSSRSAGVRTRPISHSSWDVWYALHLRGASNPMIF